MSELANYSIETEQTVLLSFKDGRHLRVTTGQLPRYLTSPDLEKIRRALKLRQDFIRRHMPRVAVVLVSAGVLTLMFAGSRVMAMLWPQAKSPDAAPSHPAIVRSIGGPSPATVPNPASVPQDQTVAAATKAPKTSLRKITLRPIRHTSTAMVPVIPKLLEDLPVASTPAPQASPLPPGQQDAVPPAGTPIGDLDPSPAPPSPSPSSGPMPTPSLPPHGQVLGDSTGPTGSTQSRDTAGSTETAH